MKNEAKPNPTDDRRTYVWNSNELSYVGNVKWFCVNFIERKWVDGGVYIYMRNLGQ